jgi:hypothetical protein
MTDTPRCQGCGRDPNDWIQVDDTRWEPDLKEVRPGVWRCWACREECRHPSMREGCVPESFKRKVERHLNDA